MTKTTTFLSTALLTSTLALATFAGCVPLDDDASAGQPVSEGNGELGCDDIPNPIMDACGDQLEEIGLCFDAAGSCSVLSTNEAITVTFENGAKSVMPLTLPATTTFFSPTGDHCGSLAVDGDGTGLFTTPSGSQLTMQLDLQTGAATWTCAGGVAHVSATENAALEACYRFGGSCQAGPEDETPSGDSTGGGTGAPGDTCEKDSDCNGICFEVANNFKLCTPSQTICDQL
ncbi:MAG: hypothetical protein JRI68_05270 [Deltaproteobacteria bacterium]|nr:hypothetical protein [Deltaproteobacteria bacterium]